MSGARVALAALGVPLVLALVGWWVVRGVEGASWPAFAGGVGAALLASLAGHAVARLARRGATGAERAGPAFLLGGGARLLLALFGVLAVRLAAPPWSHAFLFGLGAAYLLLLVLEVFVVLPSLRQNPGPFGRESEDRSSAGRTPGDASTPRDGDAAAP